MAMATTGIKNALANRILAKAPGGDVLRSFLINKNLCLYYWLKKKIGDKSALVLANVIERTILIFGRERAPHFSRHGVLSDEKE